MLLLLLLLLLFQAQWMLVPVFLFGEWFVVDLRG